MSLDEPFATEADRKRVAQIGKVYTWKVVVGDDNSFAIEYRAKAKTIQEIVARYPQAIEVKRMKR